jgi:hypothetical protein
MKTNIIILLIVVLFIGLTAHAQQKVALNSAGNTTIFVGLNPFIDAYNASVNGDTIYLSGGGYDAPTLIDKGLTIFGAGYHPDSTSATFPTQLTTGFALGENADYLHLEGMQFTTLTKTKDIQVNNLTIKRCKINSLTFSSNGVPSIYSTSFMLSESIITGQISLYSMSNSMLSNNIIQYNIISSDNNTFQNNIFLKQTSIISNSDNNIFANNVFSNTDGNILLSANGNIFENNIFTTPSPTLGTNAIDINNYKSVVLATVYVDQTGFVFDYIHDYHLQTAAATTYLGKDGNQVGIYGGLFPYKDGAVPLNPHIQFKNIAPQTDNNGDLNIQIKVAAQDE